jgi:hypothetical protein
MTRAAAQKLAWALGALVLVLALFIAPREQPADPALWMASVAYVIGLHWILAYCFDGPMYGALRLQPTQRLARAAVLVFGVALVVVALQFLLGFGGPFA